MPCDAHAWRLLRMSRAGHRYLRGDYNALRPLVRPLAFAVLAGSNWNRGAGAARMDSNSSRPTSRVPIGTQVARPGVDASVPIGIPSPQPRDGESITRCWRAAFSGEPGAVRRFRADEPPRSQRMAPPRPAITPYLSRLPLGGQAASRRTSPRRKHAGYILEIDGRVVAQTVLSRSWTTISDDSQPVAATTGRSEG